MTLQILRQPAQIAVTYERIPSQMSAINNIIISIIIIIIIII